jgi:hypothetical protein
MNNPRILKIVAALGVPGLALYVFYLLMDRFGFKFETIGPTLAGVIAILFILVSGGIILYALRAWKPSGRSQESTKRAIDTGMEVVIASTPQPSIESEEGPVHWRKSMNDYCGRRAKVTSVSEEGEPAVKLDIDSGKHWWSAKWLTPAD